MTGRHVSWILTLLTLLLALGCGGGDGTAESAGTDDGAGGEEELPAAPTVSGADARQMVADGAFLLDVTPPQRSAESHIEGATNIPLPELAERMSEVPREQPVVVYCFGGRGSPRAGAMLQAEGYDVHVLGARRHWDEAAPVEEPVEEPAEDEAASDESE